MSYKGHDDCYFDVIVILIVILTHFFPGDLIVSPRGENRGIGDRSNITNEPRSDLLAPMYGLN